ncbi:MAG: protein arginine kinase [Clostridia bacterium]|nr:protein arginine kinase [Clostridia bacterium]
MWYTNFGPSGDIVLSSRVRLARNISKIPFGNKMSDADLEKIESICKDALPELKFIDLSKMSVFERLALKENHLISPEMADEKKSGSILVNDDCTLSILIGEEDHLRIQAMDSGLSLEKCMQLANQIDDRLDKKADFAFSDELGYLTCCPSNTGTGLRASVMMHLPALTQTCKMESIIRSLSKLGIAVRGIYGEGSTALANIYQISNQVTLGISEEDSLSRLSQIVDDIIAKERSISLEIYQANKFRLEDKILRSKGILQNARIITSGEALSLISDVRWGINLGIIKDINHEQLLSALYESFPATIAKNHNTSSPLERDLKRGEIFQKVLKSN